MQHSLKLHAPRRKLRHSAASASHASHGDSSGVASIHDLERAMTLVERPPVDLDDRALFVDRLLGAEVTAARHALASYKPLKSWARTAMAFEVIQEKDAVEIVCNGDGLDETDSVRRGCVDHGVVELGSKVVRSRCALHLRVLPLSPSIDRSVTSLDQMDRPRRDSREIREGTRPNSSGRVGHSPLECSRWKRETCFASASVILAERAVAAISRAMRSLRAGSEGGTRKGSAP